MGEPGQQQNPSLGCAVPLQGWRSLVGSREVLEPASSPPIVATGIVAGRWTCSKGFAHLPFLNTALLTF